MMLTIYATSFGIAFGVMLGRIVSVSTPPWSNRHEVLVDVLGLMFIAFVLAAFTYRVYEILGA